MHRQRRDAQGLGDSTLAHTCVLTDALPLPRLVIKRKPESLFDYRFEDFELLDYYAHGSIKAPIAV